MTDSTDYLLARAEQEEILAIQAEHPKAAQAHRSLSIGYSARAVVAIVNEQDQPKEQARHRKLVETIREGAVRSRA